RQPRLLRRGLQRLGLLVVRRDLHPVEPRRLRDRELLLELAAPLDHPRHDRLLGLVLTETQPRKGDRTRSNELASIHLPSLEQNRPSVLFPSHYGEQSRRSILFQLHSLMNWIRSASCWASIVFSRPSG